MLKISLENFGCHRVETSFQFEGPGLILLQGESGSGKTSILESISFCLYGDVKKISWGEKSCKVSLTYDQWTIIRSKGPNRLLLRDNFTQKEYEDQEAQDIINSKYGTNFRVTSYITQDGAASFFSLTPAKRVAFLETLSMGDVPINELKKKCSLKIRERKIKLSELVGELKVVTEEVSKISKPDPVLFPLVDLYPEKKMIKNKIQIEANLKKKNNKNISKAVKDLTLLTAQQSQYELQKQRKDQLLSHHKSISDQFQSIQTELQSLPKYNTKELEDKIKFISINKELLKLRASRDADYIQHQAACVIEMDQLQVEYEQLKTIDNIKDISIELQQKLKSKERYLKLTNKISNLTSSIEELDSLENYTSVITDLQAQEQELLIQKLKFKDRTITHKCPKCQTFLRLGKNGLETTDSVTVEKKSLLEIESELKQIQTDRNDYEDSLRELKRLQSDLLKITKERDSFSLSVDVSIDYESQYTIHKDKLREQNARIDRIAQLKRKIENKEVSAVTQALSRRLEIKSSEIKKLEYTISLSTNISLLQEEDQDTLQKDLFNAKTSDQTRERLQTQINQLTIQLSTYQTQYESIYLEELNYADLIVKSNKNIKELKIEEKIFKEREVKILAFLAFQEKQEIYDKWQSRWGESVENEKNAKSSLTVAEKLLRKIKEAECAAVINTIDNINCHMRHYLDEFFTDPIEVEISSFKEFKTSGEEKPIINVRIFYKGYECDIKELSGGEQARLALAICLSINSMAGGSLILLDESFSSLNPEMSGEILELLKNKIQETGKLVIAVCHQANDSLFDSQVNLE